MQRRNLDHLASRVIRSSNRTIRAVDEMLRAVERSEARMRALESRPIKLSQRDTERVLRLLANPPKPNARLRRAAARMMAREPWSR